MMVECAYEFLPPTGGAPIKVLGIQPYSPGQSRKAEVWKLEAPAEYATLFGGGGPPEFDNWSTMLATLANMFCGGDKKAAEARLILKFDQRPKL